MSTLVSVRATRATNFWLAPGDAPDNARQISSGAGDLVGEGMGVAWTPDGRLVYGLSASGGLDVWVMDADGGNQKQITVDAQPDIKPTVSPDGKLIACFYEDEASGALKLALVPQPAATPSNSSTCRPQSFYAPVCAGRRTGAHCATLTCAAASRTSGSRWSRAACRYG